jgi:DNA-binding response OmpR family regulator
MTATMAQKILIVDDEPALVKNLELIFNKHHFEVIVASDGLIALERARRDAPALIILDLNLPKLDGHRVCHLLKSDERYRHIPILMLTGSVDPEDRKWAAQAGADGYVQKPFDLSLLVGQVQALISQTQSTAKRTAERHDHA